MPCASGYSCSLLIFLASLLAFSVQLATGVGCKLGDDSGFYPLYDCSDDLCVAERAFGFLDQPVTTYYCYNKNANPHWRDSCNGLGDSSTNVVQCCMEENCNIQLLPRLPSEPAVPTTYPPYRPATIAPTSSPSTVSNTNSPTTDEATVSSTALTSLPTSISASATTSSTGPTQATGSTIPNSTTEESVSTEEVVATSRSTIASTTEVKLKCEKRSKGVSLNGHPGFCYGNACFLKRERVGNPVVLGCLDENFVNISTFCSANDTEMKVVACCYAPDNCNNLLDPKFPSEVATTGTTVQTPLSDETTSGDTSSGLSDDDPFDFMLFVLAMLGIVVVLLMVSIVTFAYILWRKYNRMKIVSAFENPCTSTPSDVMSSAGSSEADLDTPTSEVKGHSLA